MDSTLITLKIGLSKDDLWTGPDYTEIEGNEVVEAFHTSKRNEDGAVISFRRNQHRASVSKVAATEENSTFPEDWVLPTKV